MLSILLISGNSKVAEEFSTILLSHYRILTAGEIPEAVRILSSSPVDVILIDSNQKSGDSIDYLNRIKSAYSDIPVLFILNDPASPVKKQALQYGAYSVIVRPFDAEAIEFLLDKAIENQRLTRELKYFRAREMQEEVKRDITKTKRYNENISALNWEVLRKLSKAITSVHNLDSLLILLCNAVSEIFGTPVSIVLTINPATRNYEISASTGVDMSLMKGISFGSDEPLLKWLYENNQILRRESINPTVTENAQEISRAFSILRCEVIAPLLCNGKIPGFISLGKKTTGAVYNEDDLELLAMISLYMGATLENALEYRQVNYDKVINESILKNIRSGIIAVNNEAKITGINPFAAKLLKLDAKTTIGEDVQKAGSIIADILNRTLRNHTLYAHHEIKEPLSKATLDISTSLLRDDSDRIMGAIAFFNDLSQVKELQSRIEHLKRAEFWSELSSRMAHEIRNPLTSIKTFTQLFPERYNEAEFRDNFVQIVSKEIDKIDNITDQLVIYSKPFRGEIKPIEINSLVSEVLNSFNKSFEMKGIKINSNSPSEIIRAKGNRELLFEAFSRIVSNSVDFLNEKGEISVSVRVLTLGDALKMPAPAIFSGSLTSDNETADPDRNMFVLIEFKDNGPGIPEENLSKVFTPFFSTKLKGIGLGLAIADKTIQQHQGRIEIDSKAGSGTTVRIFLPAYKEA